MNTWISRYTKCLLLIILRIIANYPKHNNHIKNMQQKSKVATAEKRGSVATPGLTPDYYQKL